MFKRLLFFISLSFVFLIPGCIGEPDGKPYSGLTGLLETRSSLYVEEVHWAGSVDNNGANSNPDDDFIEICNAYYGLLDFSGWIIIVEGQSYLRIVLPAGTVLDKGQTFTIGNNTNSAFTRFNMIVPGLKLPATGFVINIYDGGGKKYADTADFGVNEPMPVLDPLAVGTYLPAGVNLSKIRKSAVRLKDSYGGAMASYYTIENWTTYTLSAPNSIVRPSYNKSVFCSPGQVTGGEGQSGGGEE
jgi:hypothetical protein